jgi:outer membrane protein OmpA-like peptidoglycan-associated protein
MNKRFVAALMVFVLLGTATSAQIKQANKLFESYSYSLAIPYYLKIAQKANDPDRKLAINRLADCYRLTNDQFNAEKWYEQTIRMPETEPINWFYYGQALRSMQNYNLASDAFNKYAELVPNDLRGKAYAGFCKQVDKLTDLPAAFEVKNATSLNSERSDFGPTFYGEGIIFVSDRRINTADKKNYERTDFNNLELFFARPRYLDEFYQDMNEPKSFAGQFNQISSDGPATFSRHDSLAYFSRAENGHLNKDINNFRTDKMKIFWSANNGSWNDAQPFFLNSDSYSVGNPSLSPDGKTLYFISDMPGGFGGTDIYTCEWKNDKWSQPKNLGAKVNSIGNEMYPSINGDKLYFASDGWAGFGGLDIFCSKFTNGTWAKPENVGIPVNSSFDDYALVLDTRGIKGFFSSNRPGGLGNDDIYACKRLDKNAKLRYNILYAGLSKTDTAIITGYVKDKQTSKPMAGSVVFLVNTVKGKVKILRTDANGMFRSTVEKGVFYLAKSMENKYLADCLSFEIAVSDTSNRANTPRDLLLDQLALNKVFKFNNMNLEIGNIYFDFNKWNIRPDAEVELDKLVQAMKENDISIELASHTDSRGSEDYNIDLSQKRAESVVRYIVLQGIEPSRIAAKGYGESFLTNHCSDGVPCSPAEHQANRRTEFKVTGVNATDENSKSDLNKFIVGDEIPAYMFDKDFFINCLQDKLSKEPARKGTEEVIPPAKTQPTNVATPSKAKPEPVTAPVKVKPEEIVPAKANKTEKAVGATPLIKKEKTEESAKGELKTETSDIRFMVQLYALSRLIPLNSAEFANLEDIQRYEENGLYKYTAGIFDTYDEAHAYRDILVEDGFEGAFVVMFENGKHVNMAQANK